MDGTRIGLQTRPAQRIRLVLDHQLPKIMLLCATTCKKPSFLSLSLLFSFPKILLRSLSLNQSLNFRGFHRIDHVHSFKAQGSQGQYSNPNTITALDRALICRISRPHVLQKPSDRASGVFHSCSVDLIFSSLRFFAAVGKSLMRTGFTQFDEMEL